MIAPADVQSGAALTVLASGVEGARAVSLEQLLLLVPAFAEDRLVSTDLAFARADRRLTAVLRLRDDPRAAAIEERIAFWFQREGARVRALDELAPREAEAFFRALASSEALLRKVPPEGHAAAVRAIGAAAGFAAPPALERPELTLQVGGAGWRSIAYDRSTGLLHAPPALAPPLGDVLTLRLSPDLGGPGIAVAARAVAAGAADPGAAGPRARVGIAVADDARPVHLLLAACCAPHVPALDPDATAARASPPGPPPPLAAAPPPVGRLAPAPGVLVGPAVTLAAAAPAPRPPLVGPGEARRRVLVVDDDALARRMLADALEERGFSVLTASDGEAGLRSITDELLSLDAVVSDVRMPGLSGEELVRLVRCAGREDDLAIVVVTAASDQATRVRLTAWGADAVLPKSAGPCSVVHAVEAALLARRGAADVEAALSPERRAGAGA